jgi:hypothetical protein
MEALIDGKTLFDSSGEFRVGVIPTGLLLDQVQTIRSIAVNFVRRHVDEPPGNQNLKQELTEETEGFRR